MTDDKAQRQIEFLTHTLMAPVSALPISELVPIIVPGEFARPDWPGPIMPLKAEGLALTWTILTSENTMVYVNHEAAAGWTNAGIDWRKIAADNLDRLTPELSTHMWEREDGEPFALAMLHLDGVGPARLLLTQRLAEVFPEGWICAVPERSMGVVVSAAATDKERARVAAVVDKCYRIGTSPVRAGFFSSDDLVERLS